MRSARGFRSGLATALLAVGGCGSADPGSDPDPCVGAAYIAETNVSTADVDFYEHDLVLLDRDLGAGRQLTEHGRAYEPRFSPDGGQLAFTTGRGYEPGDNLTVGLTGIAVIDTAGGEQRDLTADHSDRHPQWSPDGSRIGFLRHGAAGSTLLVMGADGGTTEPMLEGDLVWFDWLSDQEIVVNRYVADEGLDTVQVDLTNGQITPFDLGVPELVQDGYGPPLWSPDRREFAFIRYPTGDYDPAARPVIVVHERATGVQRTVPGSDTRVNSPLLWTSGNSLMFERNVAGPDVNVALSADGGRADPVIVGRMTDGSRIGSPQDDNPACAP